ncbi:hypothetical protein HU200_002799 [Digitaria exilis]|uniref:PGG domain-containing protein n=1 Tax=Digitaria exilis TaxID=1010633 RepID=A0A835KTI5_9POAL|nr:hypothetical protein HU200_002799 [Digitaria exilis]
MRRARRAPTPRALDGEEAQEAAIFAATITYQAGLTPPSGLWPKDGDGGRRAGDPILLHNYPRRYVAFYSNTASFMSSVAVVVVLMNPNLYCPAIRSYVLSVCKKYVIMMLGILAASVTYNGGLNPPGGAAWHEVGDPVLHDNRRGWYNAFFYSNSTSFRGIRRRHRAAAVLEEPDNNPESSLTKAIDMTIVLDLLGLLVAYEPAELAPSLAASPHAPSSSSPLFKKNRGAPSAAAVPHHPPPPPAPSACTKGVEGELLPLPSFFRILDEHYDQKHRARRIEANSDQACCRSTLQP